MSPQPSPAPTLDHRQVIDELVAMGLDLARAVHKQAMAQAEAPSVASVGANGGCISEAPCAELQSTPNVPSLPDLPARFDRIARCVRRTVLLARHLAEPPRAAKPAGPDRTQARTQARTRILRRCEDRIAIAAFNKRHKGGPGNTLDTHALRRELLERLDAPELADALDHDIQSRPVPDIIDDICRDMGLGFDDMPGRCPAPRRTPADIALLHARAAATPGHMPQAAPHAGPSLAPAPAMPAPKPPPTLVPIPEDPPPDLANMLALCAQLVQDG